MPLSQVLQYLLKAKLVTLKDPPKFVNTASPNYDPKATCAYHSNATGHNADNCWALRNQVQDMIEAGEIEFDAPETPNVITTPMPKHDKTVNAIMDIVYIHDVRDLSTPLLKIKRQLIQAGLFPGCDPDCYYCARLPNGFSHGLKFEDVSVISKAPLKIPTKAPFKIFAEPRVAPIVITKPGPIPYSSDKAIPWNYGAEVYVQGTKQELESDKVLEDTNPGVDNIAGTSKVTRSGRVFSPEISPNTAPPTIIVTQMLMLVISMLSLLSCSKTHAKAMMKFLEAAHVPQDISVNQLENCIANLTTENYLGFSDADLSPSGKNHNKALHISIECGGTTLAHVLVDNGSSLNVMPTLVLDKLRPEGATLKSSDVIVKAFDGSMSAVHGEIELSIRKLKYPAKGKIVTVHGEEEYVVSFVDETKYVELTIEGFETPRQAFELVPQVISETKHVYTPPKSNKWGLGCTSKDQSEGKHPRPKGLKYHFISKGVNAISEDEYNCNLDKWVFPTSDKGLDNWETQDIVSISYNQE
ncbi:uncharacterized protein LOC131632676 [Vicia villosa]|uniref:uncharacterized protein LOC131632676 n=1 Tax=Vicia villosa TaxID=3911 RepID=UPI00273ACF82|nr:uncharacterized protein LOC131632676 [Vicia villosa]